MSSTRPPQNRSPRNFVFGILGVLGIPGGLAFGVAIAIGATYPIPRVGLLAMVGQPSYRVVARQIENNQPLATELGTPVTIDDEHVSCDNVENGRYKSVADCKIPVSGPRESGDVHAQIVAKPSAAQPVLRRHVGSKTIPGD